jgi:glycine oxidase
VASGPSDIIVVGAGVIGCAVAYELARRGASVELVDDRPVGMGATQASAGVLAPYIEAPAAGPLLDLTERSLELFDDFVARVSMESGIAVPYRRTGTLEVAMDEAGMRALRQSSDALARRGVPALLLDAGAARTEEPHLAEGIAGGLLIDTHGFVGAGDLTRALLAAARRHGAHFIEQSRVRRITDLHDELVIDTERGSLTADFAVLAAGSWSGGIEIGGLPPRVPVRPIRGQLLSIAWSGVPLRRVTWCDRCYLVPWDDGTVLVGATVEDVGFDERTTVAGVRDLLDAACRILPHGWTAGFRGARVGLRPATSDHLPIIGASTVVPKLMYATGHYRNGVLLAPLTAQLVADAILDGRVDAMLAAVSPARFGDL